jgi:hypothetical protein
MNMNAKDYASIIAVILSLIAFILSLRRERRASQESIIKALQGDKEAVMYVAYKATSPKWRKRLQNATFREDVTTAMGLAWVADSSDRSRALVFAALRQFVAADYGDSVRSVLATLFNEFTAYKRQFSPSDFQKRIDGIQEIYRALGFKEELSKPPNTGLPADA